MTNLPDAKADAAFIAAVANALPRLLTLAESGIEANARLDHADRVDEEQSAKIVELSNAVARARADALREAAEIARGEIDKIAAREIDQIDGMIAGQAIEQAASAILARIQEKNDD